MRVNDNWRQPLRGWIGIIATTPGGTGATGSPALKAGEMRLLTTPRRTNIRKNTGRDTHFYIKNLHYSLDIC